MAETNRSVVERMLDLRDEIEARLLENEDYRTLTALDRAIAEINGAEDAAGGERPAPKNGKAKPSSENVEVHGMSQADAAFTVLTKITYEPVKIDHLVKALTAHGVGVGGANPNINLSSVLSKDGRFRSVKYKDRACWWVKAKPFPGELDNQ